MENIEFKSDYVFEIINLYYQLFVLWNITDMYVVFTKRNFDYNDIPYLNCKKISLKMDFIFIELRWNE